MTYTPSIPDALMIACGGNMNIAALAARVAGFILSDPKGYAVMSLDYICGLYGWSKNTLRTYIARLQVMQIIVVTFGTHRGTQTEWRKGANFDTFFTVRKGANFEPFTSEERVQILSRKGANFEPKNKYKINNNYNYNNIKDFACGDVLTYKEFYAKFGTDDEKEVRERGFGNWERIKGQLPIKYRRV